MNSVLQRVHAFLLCFNSITTTDPYMIITFVLDGPRSQIGKENVNPGIK